MLRCLLLGALVTAAAAGCNPITAAYYLAGAPKDMVDAEFVLAPPKDKEAPTVLVLVSSQPGLQPDLIGMDRALAADFIKVMGDYARENQKPVAFVPQAKVDKYTAENPSWNLQSPRDVGKKFKADYVIHIEMNRTQLHKPRSSQLLKGRSEVAVSAYDLTKSEPTADYSKDRTVDYPRTIEVDADSMPLSRFRKDFVKTIAEELSWSFCVHPIEQSRYRVDRAE